MTGIYIGYLLVAALCGYVIGWINRDLISAQKERREAESSLADAQRQYAQIVQA